MAGREPVLIDGAPFVSGVFLVDKPAGISSFAVVKRVRYLLGVKKVGHAGTLDPFATGLLVICAGRPATRLIEQFMGGMKTYEARLQLGVATETLDPEGEEVARKPVPEHSEAAVRQVLDGFVGPGFQVPPAFSAVKYKGKPLYHYARKGLVVAKDPRPVTITRLTLMRWHPADASLDIRVVCTPGTYIRVLAEDIGRALGTCAYVRQLRRTASGGFSAANALEMSMLQGEQALASLLAGRMTIAEALHRAEEDSSTSSPLPAS
ncbi:MAG: tRNA pseudouridine(55) synthase TruB [Desulfobulbus propionicus]|nr:MAG: tRNA pseudouridine(55) synthase TruB [Desulfobulbus propionicus]